MLGSVKEFVEAVYQAPVSLGTVVALEQQTGAALIAPHDRARDAARQAPVKDADETGGKQAGARRWLGTAAATTVASFAIPAHRGARGLKGLLGQAISGIVISDRGWGSDQLPWERRQVRRAYLERDLQKGQERGGAGKVVGEVGLRGVEDVFTLGWEFRPRAIIREALATQLEPLVDEPRVGLEQGSGRADPRVSASCDNLLVLDPASWLFAGIEAVEPTNNHAERVLRMGVLWREDGFGCQSESGCRFVERILRVAQAFRLGKRSVLDFLFLEESVIAHRSGIQAPALVRP